MWSRWIFFERSGQSTVSRSAISSSAYAVIRKNHCAMFRVSTTAPQRQQRPSITCSFERTVWSFGHHLTGASRR